MLGVVMRSLPSALGGESKWMVKYWFWMEPEEMTRKR
jgi:hypothetical protein